MKKILYFLCFVTLSIHAAHLEVKFTVTGIPAEKFEVCLANLHHSGSHICSSGTTSRHYTGPKPTLQVFYARLYTAGYKIKEIKWDGKFPKGVGKVDVPQSTMSSYDYDKVRSHGLSYTSKGANGKITITANSRFADGSKKHIILEKLHIDDQSK